MTPPLKPALQFLRDVAYMITVLAVVVAVVLTFAGCATNKPLTHNIIPAGWESACANGEREAANWYRGKYHEEPVQCFYEWELLPDSRLPGVGAWCVSSRLIQARRSTHPSLYNSYAGHENRHRFNKSGNKLDNEETVK